jgi:hypothetical protein
MQGVIQVPYLAYTCIEMGGGVMEEGRVMTCPAMMVALCL